MTGIAPGAYVRVTRGMYAGTQGRVAEVTDSGGSAGPWATIDHAALPDVRFAAYVSALELVGAVPTVEQERGEQWRQAYEKALAECGVLKLRLSQTGDQALSLRAERDAAIAERDRLRRELEALRDALRDWYGSSDAIIEDMAPGPAFALADRLDAILRGES